MTTAQKVIKYIATAFAAFLVVTIISAVLGGGYILLNALGLIKNNQETLTDNLKIIASGIEEISTLKIELSCTNLEIKVGDSFKVETNNTKITFSNNNGRIEIKEENNSWLNRKNYTSNLIIYIPEDNFILDEANIQTGAGKINIEKLLAQNLYLKLGAGEVQIQNLSAINEAKVDGGVGKTELKSCEINNLKANLGVGEFIFSGNLTGKNEIDSGVGAVNINLNGEKEDYTIEVSKGLGSVTLNGQKIESDKIVGNGKNLLDIDGGIGEIKINFR